MLADLADFCCLLRPGFVQGDSHATAHAEGARSVILYVIDKIDKDESHLRRLEQKRKERLREEDQ